MWETLTSPDAREIAGVSVAWLITVSLLLVGLIGCVLPVLPGPPIIFLAAVAHRLMLGAEGSGLAWWSFLVLGAMVALVQVIELLSGAAGAKWFGGSKWGSLGALVGGLAGLFFMPIGLIVGPLAGAYGFEMAFAKKESNPAMISGMGSVAGTVVGMVVKIFFGVLMVAWFLLDVFLIG
jgi:uncharacterized protein YqgC (DUF456 family)